MKIIITGATGMLGKALIESAPTDTTIKGVYFGKYNILDEGNVSYENLDVLDEMANKKLFENFKPDVVIHAASIGSPDFAERNKEITWNTNVNGTKNIVELCERAGAKLIFISSNGIYDGDNAPYNETAEAAPVNYYGKTKLEGEMIVKQSKLEYAIVRPILMYGWPHPFERGNLLTIALEKLKRKETMQFFNDIYSNPLLVTSCAEAIWRIIDLEKYDTFNIAGRDIVSIFDFVSTIAKVFDLDEKLIIPVEQGGLAGFVKRPKNTSYDVRKMQTELGLVPLGLVEGLEIARQSLHGKSIR